MRERQQVTSIGARHDIKCGSHVANRTRDRADVTQHGPTAARPVGNSTKTWLEAEDSAERSGNPQGSPSIGSDSNRSHPGGHGGGRSATGTTRRQCNIPRIASDPEDPIVGDSLPSLLGCVRPTRLSARCWAGGDIAANILFGGALVG